MTGTKRITIQRIGSPSVIISKFRDPNILFQRQNYNYQTVQGLKMKFPLDDVAATWRMTVQLTVCWLSVDWRTRTCHMADEEAARRVQRVPRVELTASPLSACAGACGLLRRDSGHRKIFRDPWNTYNMMVSSKLIFENFPGSTNLRNRFY